MPIINMLYKDSIPVTDKIIVRIPKVGEILENETAYYNAVSLLTSMPIDMMALLDDMGIDFTTINEYDLFLLLFGALRTGDTSLIFRDLDLSKFRLAESTENGLPVLVDTENDIIIDRAIHGKIAATIRKINHIDKNIKKPGNEEARKYMLKRARDKAKRNKHRGEFSQLEPLIVAMVNAEQYKYGYEGTRELSIYQFNESVQQIIKKTDYNNRMYGVYAGTVNVKELSQDDLNWLVHK